MRNFDYTSIRLEITSKCNLFCKYCHDANYLKLDDDLSTAEIKKLIYNLNQYNKLKKVLLTGGEPLLNKDIIEIVQYITSLNIKVDMVTNGTLLTEDLILKLEKAGLKRLRISIDVPEGYDDFRKVDSNKLWKLARFAKEETSINICIHTVFSYNNCRRLEQILDKIIALELDRWRVFQLGYQGNALSNSIAGDLSYYKEYTSAVIPVVRKYLSCGYNNTLDMELEGLFKTNWLKTKGVQGKKALLRDAFLQLHPCHYIHYQGTIRSNGLLTQCQYMHDPIVDFRSHNFDVEEAYKSFKPSSFDNLTIAELTTCKSCRYQLLCMGTCRARADYFEQSIYAPDPVSCILKKNFFDKIFPLLDGENKEKLSSFLLPEYGVPDIEFIALGSNKK